ncbi:hypothetical protein DEO23_02425 [Brachybacterium endophyticum]|uniref:GxGYxYP putative glycoside hydrolase N-terminal domain-containing protein n=1 Tax=Brachybacterium endophyticum TaxID=2182385 RepID=A0A2U2RP16_9MICO|nr:GxGYxYP domain-containing protein [Brachybacterium endophyticum]PWH07504.1 hypothetical protein DEO23_02425 [Brachybacterium endophyticum]
MTVEQPCPSPLTRRATLAGGVGATALALGGAPAIAAGPAPAGGHHGGPHGPSAPAVHWERGHLFPTFDRPQGAVRVADMRDLDGFDRLLLVSLQGLVNRVRPEIYLIADDVDATWLPDLGVRTRWEKDPLSLLERFRRRVEGAVVYDMDAPDTINLATTIAARRSLVVATAEQARTHHLRIVEDLRGRFDDEPSAIYAWAVENLWEKSTHRLLVGLPPTQTVEVEGTQWTELLREKDRVTDSSNLDTYTVELADRVGEGEVFVKLSDAFTDDGWGPTVRHATLTIDGEQTADFTPGGDEETPYLFDGGGSATGDGTRFADGGASFIYRFEVPDGASAVSLALRMENEYVVSATSTAPTRIEPFASFRDLAIATNALVTWLPPSGESGSRFEELLEAVEPGTVYAGWFSNDVDGEWSGVELCSRHGVIVVAADYYMNASVLSGIPAPTRARPSKPSRRRPENRTYLTLTFGEGDNIQFCERHLRELWDDPARGSVPMNWTITPLLEDVGPALLHHFQRTASENDLLVCGPSGAGYTYGDSWPKDQLEVFTKASGRYQERTGLDVVYAYSTPEPGKPSPTLPDRVLESYAQHVDLRGIIQTDEKGSISDPGAAVPLIGTFYPAGGVETYLEALTEKIETEGGDGPLFIAGLINAWNWTPADVKTLVESLPGDVEVLLADEFFDLFARSA